MPADKLLAFSGKRSYRQPLDEIERYLVEHRKELERYARKLTTAAADIDDLVQSTAQRALERYDRYAPGTDVGAWMRRMMYCLFIDQRRSARVHDRSLSDDPACAVWLQPTPDEQPEEEMTDRWQLFEPEDLFRTLVALDPEQRQVYELRVRGLSYRGIADRLGIPPSTVGTRLYRARANLRTRMLGGRTRVSPLQAPKPRPDPQDDPAWSQAREADGSNTQRGRLGNA